MATGNGLRLEIGNKVIGFGGHIQIRNYQPSTTYQQSPVALHDSTIAVIQQLNQVEAVHGFAQKAGILTTDELFEGAILKGVSKTYPLQNFGKYLVSGHLPAIADSGYSDSILISQTLCKKLKLNLGDKVRMYFVREAPKPPLMRKWYISGIYQTDFDEIDQNFIIGDIKHIQRMNKWEPNEIGGYEVYLNSEENLAETTQQIRTLLPFEIDAHSVRDLNEQLFQWLDLFDLNIYLIILIMIAVATVNMSIALLILIIERTNMIGILKALGSTNLSIRKIFLTHALRLIGKGLFWGNLIGIGLCLLQQQFGWVKLDPSTYYVSQVSIDLNPLHLIILNATTLVICLICLILPSYLITRISPVKAIKFD